MPDQLERIYGRLGFRDSVVFSNFVSSVDGVVSLGSGQSSGSTISGRNEADRFLLALLRAFADAVLVGGGTLRATPGHRWTPEHVYPDLASSFRELRTAIGRKTEPRLVLLTGGGGLDLSHPAVMAGATFVTTAAGARVLRRDLPSTCDVIEVGEGAQVDVRSAIAELRDRGYAAILTEGGPHVMGELMAKNLLDEAFLTISSVVAGRDGETRLGMVAGAELLPDRAVWTRLLSVRRHGDFLFLRYAVNSP